MEVTGDEAELDNGNAEIFNGQPGVATKEDDHQNVEKKILVVEEDALESTSNIVAPSQATEISKYEEAAKNLQVMEELGEIVLPQIGEVHHHCLELDCRVDVQESNVIDSIESIQLEDDHNNYNASGSTSNIVPSTSQDTGIPQIGEVDHHLCLDCKDDVQESNVGKTDVVVGEERCIGHYTNKQKILLVGEGDFSFASCLADAFVSASNLVATSLDSRRTIVSEYTKGEKHLRNLEEREAVVIHHVDVDTMNNEAQLKGKYFDRIVFNFPHAGEAFGPKECASWYINCHKLVVSSFFKAAKNMLTEDGEIHVTHKTAQPYSQWNIVEVAMDHGLVLKREVSFDRWIYPGYENKKAYGKSWDNTFPVGLASTFMFRRS